MRSQPLRQILSACIGAPVRISQRDEAGAAGAAMMAAVAIGAYPSMESCVKTWVMPLLDAPEAPANELMQRYNQLFPTYQQMRNDLPAAWHALKQF